MCTRGVIECQVLAARGSLVRTYNAPDACGSAHAWPISIALLSDQSTIADVVAMPSTSDLRIFLRLIAPHPMRRAVSAHRVASGSRHRPEHHFHCVAAKSAGGTAVIDIHVKSRPNSETGVVWQ
jgi:hypothetical protein